MRAHALSAALHIAGMVCGVLLSGCAATAPSLRPPERDARPVRPSVWLLDVHEAPLLLLEAARFSPTDTVDVRPVGQTTQVTLRFQGAVRATPLITATGNGSPVTLRIAAAESSVPPAEHLVTSVRAGRYAEVQRALDAAPLLDRDDLSLFVVNALSEDELSQMAHNPEGNLLVERLFDELTSGNVSEDEIRRAWLLLAVENQRRYPSPDDFGRALTHARIFSYESMGFTNSGAPITASRRGDGRLAVHLTARSFRTGYSEDFLTLSGTDYVLELDELVGVRLYDEGGVLLYVPALYLQLLSNKDAAHLALKMLEAGAMGLGLGAWALGEAGAEATAAARALIWCDRAAYALGTASSLLLEHRGWIIQTFGDEGRTFLYSLEVFNSVLALYGVARVAMAAPRLVDGVRTFYKEFTTRAQRQRALGTLTEQQVATLNELQRDMGSVFEGLDAARDSRSTATANTSQASPPQAGGKVIPLDRARKPGPPPEANAQPVPSEGEETLAATGTDTRLVPIRPQSGSKARPFIASVKGPTADNNRSPSPGRPTPQPITSTAVPSPQPLRTANRCPAVTGPSKNDQRLSAPEGATPRNLPLTACKTGPGEWTHVQETMPGESALYQSQVTQHAPGVVYRVPDPNAPKGYVDFDGFDGEVLQEGKGPGYDQFLDPQRPGRFLSWFEETQTHAQGGMVDQAQRQLSAAKGLPVRWYVAEHKAMIAIRQMLKDAGIEKIDVIYKPLLQRE